MAKPPHIRAEMRVLYPVFRWWELAAGWRDTTIGHHRPRQRGHGCGAQACLERQQKHDAIPRRITGGGQGAQHGPLLDRTDHRSLLALLRGTPVSVMSVLVR